MGTQRVAWVAEGRGIPFLYGTSAAAPCPVLLPFLAVASPGVNRRSPSVAGCCWPFWLWLETRARSARGMVGPWLSVVW
jgi:hypothetical protein